MLPLEWEAEKLQREEREPALLTSDQSAPRSEAFGALYSEPNPSVFAFQEAPANGPPLSCAQVHQLPVACIKPHLDVLGASRPVVSRSLPRAVASVTPYAAAINSGCVNADLPYTADIDIASNHVKDP